MSQAPNRSARDRRRRGAWSPVPWLLLIAPLLLSSCATGTATVARESSLSDLLLALDASEKMGGDPRCAKRSVTITEVVGGVEQTTQGASSRWTERWTVDRCGRTVPYLVKFARSPEGDLDVTMQVEAPAAGIGTAPGASLADPVLQRDAMGFLSQRDFLAAGAEAVCHERKVVNTEVLRPLEGAALREGRPISGQWTERWTLDRCGKPIRYMVRFTTTEKGTTFTVEQEP